MRVFTLDNTFGYNPGRANFPFGLAHKAAIVHELDRLGIDYVEAGCPGATNISPMGGRSGRRPTAGWLRCCGWTP